MIVYADPETAPRKESSTKTKISVTAASLVSLSSLIVVSVVVMMANGGIAYPKGEAANVVRVADVGLAD